jgi:MEDS: MEthanogen/methylotroph, DcmR Sensory domain/STAS domain
VAPGRLPKQSGDGAERRGSHGNVRASGRIDAAVGFGACDHLCWVYDARTAWPDAVIPFLHDGEAHDRLLYIADKTESDLLDDLEGLSSRDRMLNSGQLMVVSVTQAYGHREGFDAGQQLATFRSEAESAVKAGYRSLRVVADASSVATQLDTYRLVAFELLLDAVVAQAPLSLLCGYDEQQIGREAARSLCFVHPLHHYRRDQVIGGLYAGDARRWRLHGEVDLDLREALYMAFAALPTTQVLHLELADLAFIEVAAVRALVALAARLTPVGGLVLHHPPAQLRWMLETWGEHPGLLVADS